VSVHSESGPLWGVRVLVGRAQHQAAGLSGELRRLGATVVEIPFIAIRRPKSFRPLDAALRKLNSYDWLILTSVNGVERMWERLVKLGLDMTNCDHLRVAAIGPATQKAIQQRGVRVDVVPEEYIAESVVRSLRSRVKGKRVLLVRAKVARDVIPRELRTAGAEVDVVEAYETAVPQSSRRRLRTLLKSPRMRPDFVTFTSSSSARNFLALLGGSQAPMQTLQAGKHARSRHRERAKANIKLDGIRLASIGPVTSATLRELGLRVDTEAREYTIPGLVEVIVRDAEGRRNSAKSCNNQ
jgi:uroporphyrinogen-III synthase